MLMTFNLELNWNLVIIVSTKHMISEKPSLKDLHLGLEMGSPVLT